jgi:hypothetical protein
VLVQRLTSLADHKQIRAEDHGGDSPEQVLLVLEEGIGYLHWESVIQELTAVMQRDVRRKLGT